MSTSRVLRIGREPDNDFVVNLATVSGYHARVSRSGRPGEGIIEDLGSTNGTAVGNPDRRGSRFTFNATDSIYLGTHSVLGAQLLEALAALDAQGTRRAELTIGPGSVVIGRDPACDRVIDAPVVSSKHARITRRDDGTFTVEDLRSANGTFLNGRRIDGIAAARPGDTIALGNCALVLALDPAVASSVPPPVPSIISAPPDTVESFGSELAEAWRAAWSQKWWIAFGLQLVVMQAISAMLTSGFDRRAFDLPDGPAAGVGLALATILSRLSFVAVAFGFIDGIKFTTLTPATNGLQNWLARASIPVSISSLNCLLAWFTAQIIAGGHLGGPVSLVVLLLGAGAGIALGLLLDAFAPRPSFTWVALALVGIPMYALGGEGPSWPRLPTWAKSAAAINPARWTFEGLMLNASDRLPVRLAETEPPTDLAEPYFPAETERVGPRGAAIALIAMLLGWGAAAAFIATSARPTVPGSRTT